LATDTHEGGARLRRVDALRALAALLVVWLHVSDAYVRLGPLDGQWLHDIAQSIDVGRIGVVAFFLVSGFVIPFSIRPGQPAPIGGFLIKRFFRIYPAYWLSIPLGVLTSWWLWGRSISARDFLLNFTLLQDVFGAQPAEGLYWTLLVELVFYALCVGLLLTRSLYDMRRIGWLAVALTLVYSLTMLLRGAGMAVISLSLSFWFLNLSMMLCGTLYRSCVFDQASANDRWLRFGVGALLLWHLLILPIGAVWAIGFERNASISYALGLLLFILGVSVVPIASRLTDWLGRISYSIYLFHPVVFQPLLLWLLQQPAGSWWRTQHLGVYLLVNIGLTLLLASGVYRWVEQPGMRLGRHLAALWTQRAARRHAVAESRQDAIASDTKVPSTA
jgi:peptidoglycan/LPS O-acetylase OafA/YrhL